MSQEAVIGSFTAGCSTWCRHAFMDAVPDVEPGLKPAHASNCDAKTIQIARCKSGIY